MSEKSKSEGGVAGMTLSLCVRNESTRKQLYRSCDLKRLATSICEGEGASGEVEVSLLFCDDPFIKELNRQYRDKDEPTDVLSFCQDRFATAAPMVLGDIVISLETVEKHCAGDRQAMRAEVRLLFCHGMLHLLNYTHATDRAKMRMAEKQAHYLGVPLEAAWPDLSLSGKST